MYSFQKGIRNLSAVKIATENFKNSIAVDFKLYLLVILKESLFLSNGELIVEIVLLTDALM